MIVEEDSNYPGFLYSVWIPVTSASAEKVQIKHVFHVASKSRMVEAVITGIVNGIFTGGGCMDLLLQFSDSSPSYDLHGLSRCHKTQ